MEDQGAGSASASQGANIVYGNDQHRLPADRFAAVISSCRGRRKLVIRPSKWGNEFSYRPCMQIC